MYSSAGVMGFFWLAFRLKKKEQCHKLPVIASLRSVFGFIIKIEALGVVKPNRVWY